MPNVEVHRPGHHTDVMWHNPDTGEDQPMVDWSFTATVDGQTGVISALFPPGTSEASAAGHLTAQLIGSPSNLGGITSAGAGGAGGSGGSTGAGPVGSGTTDGGPTAPNECKKDKIPKMKTADGT